MNTHITVWPLFAAVLFASCGPAVTRAPSEPATETDALALSPEMRRMGRIQVEAAVESTRAGNIAAPAVIRVDDRKTARIGAVVEAVVNDVAKDVGDLAERGSVLASLHTHVVHDQWADLRKAEAEVRRLRMELEFSRRAGERTARLLASKAISSQEAERAVADVRALEEQLAAADAESVRAADELEHLGIDVTDGGEHGDDHIPVRTPQAGRIIERLVTPGTAVTIGEPLFVVSDLSTLWAIAEVDERDLGLLRVGAEVEVQVSAYPGERFSARVLAIGDVVDPLSRRVRVRCEVPNRDGRLKPEMFATVNIATPENSAIVVPSAAVQRSGEHTIVVVETAPDRFQSRPVRLGEETGGRVVILDGLRAGELIVTRGAFLLKSELQQTSVPAE